MTPERWADVKAVLQDALAHEPSARATFLEKACGADDELRAEVESLLASVDGASGFLDETSATRIMRCSRCDSLFSHAHVVCPSDGEILVEDPEALVDATLDGLYHLEAVVGRGGFGTVYRARHELLRDRVAVKVLRRELAANPTLVRRFLREGRVARAIRHPNIVAINDLRTAPDGLVYMVLEFVEGRTLRDALRDRGAIPFDEALEVLRPIADALDAAHAAGVVHRDLKPENVMIVEGETPTVKVLDLGLAKLHELADEPGGGTELTLPGERLGSPSYMSPEQWGAPQAGGSIEADARTDVYALGVMAFEMLVGRRPFTGATTWDVRRAHVEGRRPADAGAAVARAFARDREQRFPSAGAFVDALAREGQPRPRSRSRVVVAVMGVVLVLGAGGVWLARTTPEPPPVAPTIPATPAPSKAYTAMTDAERTAFVDERARAIGRLLAGREVLMPPDARAAIRRQVDRYAERVGTGEMRFGREDLRFVVERARSAVPTIVPAFRREGVPDVVGVYLPFVESEYRSDETSSLGAIGMFQMLPGTATLYGATAADLRSPERSAAIAARHFRACMDEFASDRMGNALALAAYNMGGRDIRTYLDAVHALDDEEAELRFWSLASNSGFKEFENAESPRYITAFFAAAIIGEDPGVFGLTGGPLTEETGRR